MRKRIYRNMFLLSVSSTVFTAMLLMVMIYNVFTGQIKNEVKNHALFLQQSLNFYTGDFDFLESVLFTGSYDRISIIDADGKVLFDSHIGLAEIENRIDRREVMQAFETGFGEGTRYSDTLETKTFYYAVKLDNNTVLRMAKTVDSVFGVVADMIPIVIIIVFFNFILCNIFASRLTKRIVHPLNNIDLFKIGSANVYEELSPLIRMITSQQWQIKEQFLALEDRANTMKAITENMKEGILILDKKGVILSANKSAVDFFHRRLVKYDGKNILEFTRDMDFNDNLKKALSGTRCDLMMKVKGRTVQIFLNPVFINDEINGVIVLFLDITEKANADQMRREFSANVSHELKTPLTTILGYAEMINNQMVRPEDILSFSQKIQEEATRLIILIEDIIKLSQLDEGVGTEEIESCDIKAIAADAAQRLKLGASEKGIDVVVTGDAKRIQGNSRMLFEMCFNLIDNGIKYTNDGGLVTVSVTDMGDKMKMEVSDTGIGIAKEDLSRVFERFYRVDKSRSKKTGGTGLGLSIVKHIVEYHKGTISINSTEGAGTNIIVIL